MWEVINGEIVRVKNATITIGDWHFTTFVEFKLLGVNAPDIDQKCLNGVGTEYDCGQTAIAALSERMRAWSALTRVPGYPGITLYGVDKYGHYRAIFNWSNKSINCILVESGYAWADPTEDLCKPDENLAKILKKGVWSVPAGKINTPPKD